MSLGSYLLLVEYTGRLFRNGKARINSGVKDVFERLGTSAEFWNARLKKMLRSYALRGNVFRSKAGGGTRLGCATRPAHHQHVASNRVGSECVAKHNLTRFFSGSSSGPFRCAKTDGEACRDVKLNDLGAHWCVRHLNAISSIPFVYTIS